MRWAVRREAKLSKPIRIFDNISRWVRADVRFNPLLMKPSDMVFQAAVVITKFRNSFPIVTFESL